MKTFKGGMKFQGENTKNVVLSEEEEEISRREEDLERNHKRGKT